MAGAPVGNKNAAKPRLFDGAIRRALAEQDREELLAIARAIVGKAKDGDIRAAEFLRDSTDGKPKQQLEHSGTDGRAIALEHMLATSDEILADLTKRTGEAGAA